MSVVASEHRTLHPVWAYLTASFFAALAPALVMSALMPWIVIFLVAFVIALGHVILFGFPLALIAVAKGWVNSITAVAGGFMVGFIPSAFGLRRYDPTALSNGVSVDELTFFGLLGAIGGSAFWLTLKITGTLARRNELGGPRWSARLTTVLVSVVSLAVLVTIHALGSAGVFKLHACQPYCGIMIP